MTAPDKDLHPAITFELSRAAERGIDLSSYHGYTARQLREIRLALDQLGTAEFLTDRPRDYLQMEVLRQARKEGVRTDLLCDPAFDCNQMWEIREGLRSGIEARRYADPRYSAQQMRQIRLGLELGLETSGYEDPAKTPQQMLQARALAPVRPLKSRLMAAWRLLVGPRRRNRKEEHP